MVKRLKVGGHLLCVAACDGNATRVDVLKEATELAQCFAKALCLVRASGFLNDDIDGIRLDDRRIKATNGFVNLGISEYGRGGEFI